MFIIESVLCKYQQRNNDVAEIGKFIMVIFTANPQKSKTAPIQALAHLEAQIKYWHL